MAEAEHQIITKAELVEDVNIISEDQIYTIDDQNVVIQNAGEDGQYSTYIQVNDQEYMLVVADGQAIETEEGTTVVVEAPVQEAEPELTITETPRTRRTNRMFHRNRGRENKDAANNESVYDFEEDAKNASNVEDTVDTSVVSKQEEEDEEFQFTAPKAPKPRGRPKGAKKEPKASTANASSSRDGSISGGSHQCTYCDYTTNKRYLLSRHLKSHSEERPHQCSVCERGFKVCFD